jgi:outer membrane receptor protein involved in Fe transport
MNAAYETKNHWKFDYTVQWISSKRVPSLIVDGVTTTDSYSPSFVQMNAQVSKGWKEKWELYAGVENLTNYTMDNPIIGADNPYAPGFDASMIWGPIMGRNFYAGLRLKIK